MQLDALPLELFLRPTSFLTGFDLARLSCVNRRLHAELSSASSDLWKARQFEFPVLSITPPNWKERYLTSSSLRFPGRKDADDVPEPHVRGGCVELPPLTRDEWAAASFSFDVWLALLPSEHEDGRVLAGGIVIGAQSEDVYDEWWPDVHQQFLHVDTDGNVFCSVVDEKEPIATEVELHRWWHVALSFENHGYGDSSSVQRVYFNGRLIRETRGWLHTDWDELHYVQLGTGCISAGSVGTPSEAFSSWYGFNGVVDECRLWRGVLSEEDVKQLAETGDEARVHVERYWSMKESVDDVPAPLEAVRCTRPRETWCVDVRQI